jgi:hypothetical protein
MVLVQGWYFALIILYPVISAIFALSTGNTRGFFSGLINEFYLFLGITIFYFGLLLIFLQGFNIGSLASFFIYTIIYWTISLLRKTLFTSQKSSDTKDLTSAN